MSMTQQEIFDKVAKHLLTQKGKAMDAPEGGACQYRGLNNTACAVGCLIPDEVYSPRLEGTDLGGLIQRATIWNITLPAEITDKANYPLLRSLQVVHDMRDPETWSTELLRTADIFQLNNQAIWQV